MPSAPLCCACRRPSQTPIPSASVAAACGAARSRRITPLPQRLPLPKPPQRRPHHNRPSTDAPHPPPLLGSRARPDASDHRRPPVATRPDTTSSLTQPPCDIAAPAWAWTPHRGCGDPPCTLATACQPPHPSAADVDAIGGHGECGPRRALAKQGQEAGRHQKRSSMAWPHGHRQRVATGGRSRLCLRPPIAVTLGTVRMYSTVHAVHPYAGAPSGRHFTQCPPSQCPPRRQLTSSATSPIVTP